MHLTNVVFGVKTGVRELYDNFLQCLWKPTNLKCQTRSAISKICKITAFL
jgi:hypothetical protein